VRRGTATFTFGNLPCFLNSTSKLFCDLQVTLFWHRYADSLGFFFFSEGHVRSTLQCVTPSGSVIFNFSIVIYWVTFEGNVLQWCEFLHFVVVKTCFSLRSSRLLNMLAVNFLPATSYATIRLMFKTQRLEEYCYRARYDFGLPCLAQFRCSYYTWFDSSVKRLSIAVQKSL